jgi:uncharacterized membrane protein YGL010W
MKPLPQLMREYADYHRDWRNRLTHFFGIPLVTFALFVPLGWLRWHYFPEAPCASAAAIFCLGVLIYYFWLDWIVTLTLLPASVALVWAADRVSLLPFSASAGVFTATFVAGWMIQLLGHVIEGRRPALADNVLHIFNAPLFLTVEVLMALGFCEHLSESLKVAPTSPLLQEERVTAAPAA